MSSANFTTAWTVDFWLDPSCPLTRHTAQWIRQITNEIPLRVCWHVMSLSVLNEHRDDDPEGDPDGYLWVPARIAAAVMTEHGHEALGAFYDALWAQPDDSGRDDTEQNDTGQNWLGGLEDALRRCGLPVELAQVGLSTDYDQVLRDSHHAGVDRIDARIGTPVLVITTPEREQRALFGPVLSAVPPHEEALRLWDAVVALCGVDAFRQIKA